VSSLNVNVDPSLIDLPHSFDGMLPGGSEDELCAAGAVRFPDKLRIPRSDWDDWINQNDQNKSSGLDFSARQTHQGSSHECVCHASIQSFEIAYNRQFAGTKYAFYGAPLGLYTFITGGQRYGGSVVMEALRALMNTGLIPEHDGPDWLGGKGGQAKRFKHTVHQTSGRSEDHWQTKGWIAPSQLPDGWRETARHFRVLEAFTIPDREAHFSALLRGLCIVNGRNGHSIPHVKAVKSGSRYLSMYRDPYNRDLYDSEGMTGNGYAISVVTAPDDPLKPAGADMKG
jgi:hypothetical protein